VSTGHAILNGYCGVTLLLLPCITLAAPASLQYQYGEQVFRMESQKSWQETNEVPTYRGREIRLEPGEALPSGVVMEEASTWSKSKIASTLDRLIGDALNREAGSVRIFRNANGDIAFEGVGLNGRKLDLDRAAELTLFALKENVPIIQLPVTITEPNIVVDDPQLKAMGITELVTIGESDYAGSPKDRVHNIAVGLARFHGQMIPKGEEFSFGKILGPVNAQTGYLPELTILGERTLPEFGGGLCQVSTTAYRGAWRAGLPITARRNHSYAVRYYSPAGTDATVYPPWTDMRFMNDTEGALLIQTHHADEKAYFIYYGTKPLRSTELVGPFTWDPIAPPPDRIEYTDELPPGESRVVSKPVPGMKAMWYRIITEDEEEQEPEEFASFYEARPYFEEIGALLPLPGIVKTPERNVIRLSENATITLLRRNGRTGPRIRIRR